MKGMDSALTDLYHIREEASGTTWLHAVYPPFKLLLTCLYIMVVASVPKEKPVVLCSLVLYPFVFFVAGHISFRACFYRIRIILPFLCAVGFLNLFFDREVVCRLGSLPVTGGILSFLSLLIKGLFDVLAVYILVITTTVEKLGGALVCLHCPRLLVTVILLIYRYVGLLMEETGRMLQAYKLRAPGQKGIRINAWGSFVGMLLLRTFDRAEQLHASMRLRGFRGEFTLGERSHALWRDWLFLLGGVGMIMVLRLGHG